MMQRRKIISASSVFGDFRPKYFIRDYHRRQIVFTPEEFETFYIIKKGFIMRWKRCTLILSLLTLPYLCNIKKIFTC